jgi:hypothetical protein
MDFDEWVVGVEILGTGVSSLLLADETVLCSRDTNVLVEAEGETNVPSDVVSVGEGAVEGGTDFFLPASTLRMMRGSNPSFPEEEPSVDMLMGGLSRFVMTPTPTSVVNVSALPFITMVFVLGLSVSSDSLPAFLPITSPISTPLGTPTLSLPSLPHSSDALLDG